MINNSFSYAYGPIIGFLTLLLLITILRWAFSGKKTSIVAAPSKPGLPEDYGTLVPIASPANYIEGEMMRMHLLAAGVKANLTQTLEGPQLFVFPEDTDKARMLLKGYTF